MKNSIFKIFLPIYLGLLGAVAPAIADKSKSDFKPWAGYKTNLTFKDDWDLTMRYSEAGRKYFAEVDTHNGALEGRCEGAVDERGSLEKVECAANCSGFHTWHMTGNVSRIEILDTGTFSRSANPVFEDKKLAQRIKAGSGGQKMQSQNKSNVRGDRCFCKNTLKIF